jgi:tripeptide aminopeptidase
MSERNGFDQKVALQIVLELLKIPGPPGKESKVAQAVKDRLRKAGVPAASIRFDRANAKSPLGGETGNLICTLPGTVDAPRRLLMAHLDTVPLCVGAVPRVSGSLIRNVNPKSGLGGDNRAGASAVLFAALEVLRQKKPHPPLTFLWPVQEEVGLVGARNVDLKLLGKPELCFNFDGGTASRFIHGATGAIRIYIDIRGIASHAGAWPERGVNAATIASLAISELHKGGWLGKIKKGRNSGTSNIGVINGGAATNVIMPELTIRAEARSHSPSFRRTIARTIQKAFEKAVATVRNASGSRGSMVFKADYQYESFLLSEKARVVSEAARAIKSIGLKPAPHISNGGLDANWMTAHGLPTVTLGAGQMDIHTVNEKLDLKDYFSACQIALALARG